MSVILFSTQDLANYAISLRNAVNANPELAEKVLGFSKIENNELVDLMMRASFTNLEAFEARYGRSGQLADPVELSILIDTETVSECGYANLAYNMTEAEDEEEYFFFYRFDEFIRDAQKAHNKSVIRRFVEVRDIALNNLLRETSEFGRGRTINGRKYSKWQLVKFRGEVVPMDQIRAKARAETLATFPESDVAIIVADERRTEEFRSYAN